MGFSTDNKNPKISQKMKDLGYEVKVLPSTSVIKTTFPIRGFLSYFMMSLPWRRMSNYMNDYSIKNEIYKTVGVEIY